jgi:hypothetical protein
LEITNWEALISGHPPAKAADLIQHGLMVAERRERNRRYCE